MTLVSEILEGGFREAGTVSELQSPTPTQMTQALARLQNVVSSAYGFEVGEQLHDWPIGLEGVQFPADFTWTRLYWERPRINVRLIAASSEAETVYLPERPWDGSRVAVVDPASRLAAAPMTLNGNGRTIENAATVVLNTNGTIKIWLYRADLGNWTPVTPLAYTDTFPFPEEFDDYFITQLAMRLNPRYGRSMSPASLQEHMRSLTLLQARYRQSENTPVDPALRRLSGQYQDGDRDGSLFSRSPNAIGDQGWM